MSKTALRLLGTVYEEAAERVHRRYLAEWQQIAGTDDGVASTPLSVQTYHILPWLFRDVFPNLPDEHLSRIAVSGLLYFSHVLTLDRVLDGDQNPTAVALLLASRLHERALTLLFPILPGDTKAWDRLGGYVDEYARSVVAERERIGHLGTYTLEAFRSLASGKSAILKGSPLMMASTSGREECLPALESALDEFAVAAQIHDDLKDWREDYRAGRYSRVLARALNAMGINVVEGEDRPVEELVGHGLFYTDVAQDELDLALRSCDHSASAAERVGANEWQRFAMLYRKQLEQLATGFERLRSNGLNTREGPVSAAEVDTALSRLGRRLAREHRLGYPEMQHRMRFASKDGFTGAQEIHSGDVFQRALVGWVAPRLAARGYGVPPEAVEANLATLLDARRDGERGGWSYFPTLPELPPDADDLAQVLQALLAADISDAGRWFDEPVNLVLEHARQAGGAIETWILDPDAGEDRLARYRWGVAEHWGRGVDPEVIANFYYALWRWDAERFRLDAEAGAERVVRAQHPDGYWESTWYVGPYYGTYVCARLIASVWPEHDALGRAFAWIMRTQRPDGGWGDDHQSWPLQTAFGLLGCLACRRKGERLEKEASVQRALRYLVLAQRGDGFWTGSPFIQMDVRRAAEAEPEYLTYKSATISSVFVAAALLEIRDRFAFGS